MKFSQILITFYLSPNCSQETNTLPKSPTAWEAENLAGWLDPFFFLGAKSLGVLPRVCEISAPVLRLLSPSLGTQAHCVFSSSFQQALGMLSGLERPRKQSGTSLTAVLCSGSPQKLQENLSHLCGSGSWFLPSSLL